MRRSPSITGRAAVLPLAILAVLMSCAGGGDGGYPSIFGTWKYEDLYTRWILEIDEDSWESNIYSYAANGMGTNDLAPLQWDYLFGIRGTYTLSGDGFTSTLLGSDSTVWDAVYAVSRSGNYLFQYADFWGETGAGGSPMAERIGG